LPGRAAFLDWFDSNHLQQYPQLGPAHGTALDSAFTGV